MRERWMVCGLAACAPSVPELPEVSTPGLVLVVHGGGDDPSVWADGMVDAIRSAVDERGDDGQWTVLAPDWSDDADVALTAARRGRRVGHALAPQLEDYDAVHVIAHSVGAHLGDALLGSVDGPATTQLTLLDPFVGSGLLRWRYGRERFGATATFADAYVHTDDGVPSTDGFLDGAHNFDVTEVRPEDLDTAEEGHRWPIEFYRESRESGIGLDLAMALDGAAAWSDWPPGEVTVW